MAHVPKWRPFVDFFFFFFGIVIYVDKEHNQAKRDILKGIEKERRYQKKKKKNKLFHRVVQNPKSFCLSGTFSFTFWGHEALFLD